MNAPTYLRIRTTLIKEGYKDEINWAQTVTAPRPQRTYGASMPGSSSTRGCAIKLPRAYGRRFGLQSKKDALPERSMAIRQRRQQSTQCGRRATRSFVASVVGRRGGDPINIAVWCEGLPWIGPTTSYHLAKNLGAELAKPDRWLERVARRTGESVQSLCERLAKETGDRVATVDLVIWRACNLGIVTP